MSSLEPRINKAIESNVSLIDVIQRVSLKY
jgi:hypothetical protein